MKEKDRKVLEKKKLIEFTKAVHEIKNSIEYPKKDIGMLAQYHSKVREGFFSEIVESLLGEYNNILIKLERYGENSNYWSRNEVRKEYKSTDSESKGPSIAWLRAKVKRYEFEATKQISTR